MATEEKVSPPNRTVRISDKQIALLISTVCKVPRNQLTRTENDELSLLVGCMVDTIRSPDEPQILHGWVL